MSKANKPAFPCHVYQPRNEEEDRGYLGLTKRELFAAMAMQGYVSTFSDLAQTEAIKRSSKERGIHPATLVAQLSLQYADALLAEMSLRSADALLAELERETNPEQKESV